MKLENLQTTEDLVPLKEYDIPIRNIWYMLLYVWNEPLQISTAIKQGEECAPTLDALLCLVLIRLIQQRFRIGLGRNYLDENNLIRGVRGQVKFGECIKHNLFNKGQTFCRFQEYSINVPKNQIIRTTMIRMARLGKFGPDKSFSQGVRQKLRMASLVMDGIDFTELSLDILHRQQLGRNDRDYRIMLAICELLFQRYMPTDSTGLLKLPKMDREDFTMYHIFEVFIANFYRYHLQDWEVYPQKVYSWNEKTGNKYLPSMRPDLVLVEKESNRIIVLDTKYSKQLAKNQWGNEAFHSGHLYQMYTYLKTQEELSEHHFNASGILLYPATKSSALNENIVLINHEIGINCIDLSAPWQEIEMNLLELIKCKEHFEGSELA